MLTFVLFLWLIQLRKMSASDFWSSGHNDVSQNCSLKLVSTKIFWGICVKITTVFSYAGPDTGLLSRRERFRRDIISAQKNRPKKLY